jgi:hypothetical protein
LRAPPEARRERRHPRVSRELGPIFSANYPGQCSGCFDRIHVDDQVRYLFGELVLQDCCGAEYENLVVSEQGPITVENFLERGGPP